MRLIKVGKALTNDIVISNDSTVSRLHLQIFVDDEDNKFVTDLNSTNGTFVNGNKISESVQLDRFDIVRAGNSLVKWKEYLMGEELPSSSNEETIMDVPEDFDVEEELGEVTSKPRKKKKSYLWIYLLFAVAIVATFVYFNSDEQKIVTKWTAKNDSELSYTFFKDNTFEKDSAEIIKTGEYTLINGREKKLELIFDEESLPVYVKELNTYKKPDNGLGQIDGRKLNEYYGNTFNLINTTDFPLKIIGLTTNSLKNGDESSVSTKVYYINHSYISEIHSQKIELNLWNFIYIKPIDVIDWKFTEDIIVDNLIIPERRTYGIVIISNISAEYVNGIGRAGITVNSQDQYISVTEGHSTSLINNACNLAFSPRNWNGIIKYGVMNPNINFKYEFAKGYLELNGQLFKK